ncbi:MAG: hypothetical protein IJY84_00020 [Clostridia bacterium]|nr:hypothetical protein [Clostridia bacterium]
MGTIFNLLKLQIDNTTDLLKAASPYKMLMAIAKTILLLVAIVAGVELVLFRVFVLGIKANDQLFAIVLLATQAISLIFAVGHIINTLYFCKDNEMLICLPVTPNQLFISKIILIYLKELAVNALISLPIFISIAIFGGYGITFYLSIPILLLLLPILPIVLASFISIPVMAVIRFFKKHTFLSIIGILALVAGCLWLYISLIGSLAGSFNIATDQIAVVKEINETIFSIGNQIVVYLQLAMATSSFAQWFWYPLFLVICAALLVVTVLIIRPFYFKMAMSNLENTVKTNNKPKEFKQTGVFFSLIKKEILCVFRSPTDIFEYFLFTLLMPFIVFSYDKLLMSITVNQAGVNMIAGSHVMVVAILAMLSNIASASAISRDGGNFYNSKIIPVDYYTQVFAKFTFNAVFTCAALIVTMIISFFIYPAWQIILGTIAVMFASIGHIALGIDMDLKNPTVNLQGDEQSSTVSKSTPKSIIWGLVIGFILGLIVILMSGVENVVIPYLIIMGLSLVFAIYRVIVLILRINLTYDKIEM